MIALKTLKEAVENRIINITETLQYGYNYHIVSDTGEYKKPERLGNEVTEYVQGVFTLTNSDVSELTGGILYASQTCHLQLEVALPNHVEDRAWNELTIKGSERIVSELREVLETLASEQSTAELTDANGTKYLVTTVYSLATSGQRSQIAQEGDSFTFNVFAYYSFVENGVNSRNVVFTLDGLAFPYQAVTINRAKTLEGNVPANSANGSVKNIAIQSNWSAIFELPALANEIYAKSIALLTASEPLNTAHLLSYTLNGVTYVQLVIIGEVNLNAETIKNVTLKLPFYEASDNYLQISLPKGYYVYKSNPPTTTSVKTVTFGEGKSGSVAVFKNDTLLLTNIWVLGTGKAVDPSPFISPDSVVVTTGPLEVKGTEFELIKKIT